MKKIFLIFSIVLLANKLFAQSTEINGDYFKLPVTPSYTCPVAEKGKLYYNSDAEKLIFCSGNSYNRFNSNWVNSGNSISHMGGNVCVGAIGNYQLLVGNSKFGVRNNLYIGSKITFNTLNVGEKLQFRNNYYAISSTVNAKTWLFQYVPETNQFAIFEKTSSINFAKRIIFLNGGKVLIGSPTSDNGAKFLVEGNGSFAGNVKVEGLGMMQNSTTSQLIMLNSSFTTPASFTVAQNTCKTTPLTIASGTFTAAPAIFLGNNISGGSPDEGITITIEAVTSTSATVRFCNNTQANTSINNTIYRFIALGQ